MKLLGFESAPLERVQLELTGPDVKVLEWLRGRTTQLPDLFTRDQAESVAAGLTLNSGIDEKAVRGFLARLWDVTGHMRCCADPNRAKP
jgi:hypothetical protein